MNIKEQLLQGKPFSGRNGAFTGRVEPQSIDGDTLIVICDRMELDGMKVGNFNILSGVLNVVIIISYE
nr:MAG: hypothetical protein [Bacteriophage sp.]